MLVAEIGVNWGGDLEVAEEMIRLSKMSGADAVKFQAFLPEHVEGHPDRKNLVKCSIDREAAVKLKKVSDENEIEFFCTPFYPDAVDWLEEVGVKRYKIRERDARAPNARNIHELPEVMRRAIRTNKPVIASSETIPPLWLLVHPSMTFLYCVPKYPSLPGDFNFTSVSAFGGFSNHCPDWRVPATAAVAFRVWKKDPVIECHVVREQDTAAYDRQVSLTFSELLRLSQFLKMASELKL